MGTLSKRPKHGQRQSRCAVTTGSLARARVERRFGELVVKYALGKITPEEKAKLERYQRLRRELDGTAYTTPDQARREYADGEMLKALKRLTRKGLENARGQTCGPAAPDSTCDSKPHCL